MTSPLPVSPSKIFNIFDKSQAWIDQHPEAVREFVTTAYRTLLGREPDAEGFRYWCDHVEFGTDSPLNLVRSFVNSTEFKSHHESATDVITSLYHVLLGREPDAAGLAYWVRELTGEAPIAAGVEMSPPTASLLASPITVSYDLAKVATNFARSDEFVKHEGITNNALSLMGGGYKALYGDAAMVAGLLQYQETQGNLAGLKNLFSDLEVVSANSGSTWFVDLLGYSTNFAASLQDYKNFVTPSGYGGKLNEAFDQYFKALVYELPGAVQDLISAAGSLVGKDFAQYAGVLANIPDWNLFLDKTVFQPYGDAATLKATNFADGAKGEVLATNSLVYIGALSSDGAAINQYDWLGTNATLSSVENAGKAPDGSLYNFIPVLFSSPASAADRPATALPTVSSGDLIVKYATNGGIFQSDATPNTITLTDVSFDGFSAYLASSISSAAAAAVDSKGVLQGGILKEALSLLPNAAVNLALDTFKDLAPLGQATTSDGFATVSDPVPGFLKATSSPSDFSTASAALRFADGGYIDNPSVTAALNVLQNNERLDGFVVTLFNYLMPGDTGDAALNKINADYAHIGNAASQLFTGSSQMQSLSFGGLVDLSHPTTAVFDSSKTTGLSAPVWSYTGSNNFSLSFYQLGVTTAANNGWGLDVGEAGTFNVWNITSPVDAIPQLNGLPYSAYNDFYSNIVGALQTTNNGLVGASLLEQTFGIL